MKKKKLLQQKLDEMQEIVDSFR